MCANVLIALAQLERSILGLRVGLNIGHTRLCKPTTQMHLFDFNNPLSVLISMYVITGSLSKHFQKSMNPTYFRGFCISFVLSGMPRSCVMPFLILFFS